MYVKKENDNKSEIFVCIHLNFALEKITQDRLMRNDEQKSIHKYPALFVLKVTKLLYHSNFLFFFSLSFNFWFSDNPFYPSPWSWCGWDNAGTLKPIFIRQGCRLQKVGWHQPLLAIRFSVEKAIFVHVAIDKNNVTSLEREF